MSNRAVLLQCASYFVIFLNNFLPRFRIKVILTANETYAQCEFKKICTVRAVLNINDIILNLESQAWGRIFHDFYENMILSQ